MRRVTAIGVGGISLVLTACASTTGASDVPAVREVALTMTDATTFEPAQLNVTVGETVVFAVRNESGESHEAYVGTRAEQLVHEQDHSALPVEDQGSSAHLGYGVHIAPFGTGRLEYVFELAGEYEIGCHYPGHYGAGMRALVTVADG